MTQFYVKGIPTKRRPRMTRDGHMYKDPLTVAEEAAIAYAYRGPFYEGKVRVFVDIYPKLPKRTPKGSTSSPMLKKPDGDNVLKIVQDALNGIAYKDDAQVCSGGFRKHDMQRIDFEYIIVTVTGMERE